MQTELSVFCTVGPGHASPAASGSMSVATSPSEFEVLQGLSVIRAKNGDNVPLVSVFQVSATCQ